MERTLDLCRELYNAALQERRDAWRIRGVSRTYADQCADLPDLKRAIPELKEINGQVLQDVLRRVDLTFRAYGRRRARGEKCGYPRFKGRRRYHSFTFPQTPNRAYVKGRHVVLSHVGRVPLYLSRPLEGVAKTATLTREEDGWYIVFACADVPIHALPHTRHDTGVDVGLTSFATLSDGSQIASPRIHRVAESSLRRAHRRVDRRRRGSQRRGQARHLLARSYQKVRRQRRDFHHKTALALVRQYDVIYHEMLQVANMVKHPYLGKSIWDAGWGAFLLILAYKAACAGKQTMAVNPAYTSQVCSGCGVVVPKSLSVRWHSCPECGAELDRDHNAALNILARGREQSALGQSVQART